MRSCYRENHGNRQMGFEMTSRLIKKSPEIREIFCFILPLFEVNIDPRILRKMVVDIQ